MIASTFQHSDPPSNMKIEVIFVGSYVIHHMWKLLSDNPMQYTVLQILCRDHYLENHLTPVSWSSNTSLWRKPISCGK